MFEEKRMHRLFAALLALTVCCIAFPSDAAPKKPAPAASAKAKPAPKKAKRKAKSPAKAKTPTISSLLAAHKIKTHKHGTTLYAEVPPTRLPSKPGTKKPKRMQNYWAIFAARRIEPVVGQPMDEGVSNVIDLAKEMRARDSRSGGLIIVFFDPADRKSYESFAKLVVATQRTVSAVNCRNLNLEEDVRSPEMDCKDIFSRWGMPAIIGYRPNNN